LIFSQVLGILDDFKLFLQKHTTLIMIRS